MGFTLHFGDVKMGKIKEFLMQDVSNSFPKSARFIRDNEGGSYAYELCFDKNSWLPERVVYATDGIIERLQFGSASDVVEVVSCKEKRLLERKDHSILLNC